MHAIKYPHLQIVQIHNKVSIHTKYSHILDSLHVHKVS